MTTRSDKIEWQDDFSVGVKVLDDDHKRLISIINRTSEDAWNGVSTQWAIKELQVYASYHFRREETKLKRIEFTEFAAHKKEHQSFIKWLETVSMTYRMNSETEYFLTETINSYLHDWLIHHILESDMKYKGKIH